VSAERLQKVLAGAGIASRRDCEALIAAGRVTVNGKVVLEPGLRVDPEQDVIQVDGEVVRRPVERTYIMLHKPVGYVSTVDDPHGRPTVLDLVDTPTRVFPVGRLDVDSEGLILLTDDGELTHYLTHPKFEVEKEYRVLLDRPLDSEALRQWRNGVLLNDELTAPAWVELIETAPEGPWYRIVLREGRKRQIREVAKLLGYEVQRLIRVREGDIALGDLPPREWRPLTPEEIAKLRSHVPARAPRDEEGAASGRAAGVVAGVGGAAGARAARGTAGERPPRREGGYREERPPRRYEERPPRYEERPPRREGGYREERPPRYEERPPRREGGYREERPPRPYQERPPRYEERPPRREGGYREERPPRPYQERPPRYEERPPRREGGYREERPPRRYDERPPRREGGYREERPPRRYEERPPRYEERPLRREGGYREERPPRYEERPLRREGGYREEWPPRGHEGPLPRDEAQPLMEGPPARGEAGRPSEAGAIAAQPAAEPPRPAKVAPGARRGRGRFGRRAGGQAPFRARPRLPERET